MCTQRSDLFGRIESVLTLDQAAKLKDWISKIKSPC